ncbi:MAG: CDP-glycerol glycerophosphotransferase family protein [Oscillospiraceae bacterium]|nr:CDP-glycerol glycerophosphotransferase family protein [Oscillospiraceae bacterium]
MTKKEITFIYADDVQKQVYEMIAREAERRGYKTRLTDDKFEKCEIGWYCDHVNHPQYSKFSIIMLHDLMQQFGNWPDIWRREPWNKYDIGFLPSKVWEDNWDKCSQYYYANPRKGIYLTGWPKADRIITFMDENKKNAYSQQLGIDPSKKTILYAPAWENDHKQDEFVQSMLKLNVNIVVKQAPWPESYPEQLRNIKEMYELHKDNPRVIQIDPKVNILDVIAVSDVLVSEESSTMSECVMMGKPAISVNNWLIPDVTPSRYPANDYEYVIKTDKEQLTECVSNIVDNYEQYRKEAQHYSDTHFSNIGKCIPMMLDIVDATIDAKDSPYPALIPNRRKRLSLGEYRAHKTITIKKELANNYCVRIPIIRETFALYLKLRGRQ